MHHDLLFIHQNAISLGTDRINICIKMYNIGIFTDTIVLKE